jgi:hypothetical protein
LASAWIVLCPESTSSPPHSDTCPEAQVVVFEYIRPPTRLFAS